MVPADTLTFPGEREDQQTPRRLVLDLSRRRSGDPTADHSLIVCTTPRSGSWMLCTALAATHLAGYANEYFLPEDEASWAQVWGVPTRTTQYLSAAVRQGTSANGVFSAKIMASHLPAVAGCLGTDPDDALSVAFPAPRFVWLRRRDRHRQALSLHRAIETGEWSVVGDPAPVPRPTADPPVESLSGLRDWLEREDQTWRRVFAHVGVTPEVLWYEDLTTPDALRDCVARLLDLVTVRLGDSVEIAALTERQSDEREGA